MKTFKKVVSRMAIFIIILSMMITSQITITSAAIDLNGPDFNFTQILFTKHQPYPSTYGENHMCDGYFGFNGVPGGGVFILNNAFGGAATATNILTGKTCTNGRYAGQQLTGGAFFKADLNYAGNKIVFCYTDAQRSWDVWNLNTTYHVFTCNTDGTSLTQLTDGVYNDINPIWMPDGKICFISERRGGYGRCHQRTVPTFTLHTMNSDGSNIRTISMHETNEWNPAIDNSGMIIFTRWDYVNRGATHTHSSWICAPDGSDARPIALQYTNSGANPWRNGPPMMQTYIRPIPNSNKLISAAVPHHGQSYGSIIIVDPDVEDDDYLGCIKKITTELNYPESVTGATGNQRYSTPWALSETNYLCVYSGGAEWSNTIRYGIYALDSANQKTLLYNDATISCLSPIPLRARTAPPSVIATSKPAGAAADGIVSLMNVYDSLLPFPGGVTTPTLRIWQVYGKSTIHADDPSPSYESTQSDWAGRNTQGLLGTVPIETDGSAAFYAPANKCLLFQAVDANDEAVQTMRSNAFVIGGMTRLTCQGCHEPRHRAPAQPSSQPIALRNNRTPSTITADAAQGSRPMCFPRLLQPILDAKCISCHVGGTRIDLRKGTLNGDGWSVAYLSLRPYVFQFDAYYGANSWDYVYPRTEPTKFGSKMSTLYTTYLKNATHNALTTTAEKHAFRIWLDSGFEPYYGAYNDIAGQQAGNQVENTMD